MKFIATADWHIWDKHIYSVNNSRLIRIQTNIKKIINTAIKQNIKLIVVAGDIFHVSNPTEKLLNVFIDLIQYGIKNGIMFRIITGNHDTDGIDYSIQSMNKITEFIPEINKLFRIFSFHKGVDVSVYSENFSGVNFIYVPWQKDMVSALRQAKSLKTKNSVLVTHVGVVGANVSSGYEPDSEIEHKLLNGYKYIALGDYHNAQRVIGTNAYYSGSIFRMNWGEANDVKGFNVIDTNTWKVKRIKLYDSPMINLDINYDELDMDGSLLYEIGGKKVKNSFVKLNVNGNLSNTSNVIKLEKLLYESGASQVFTTLIENSGADTIITDDGNIDLSLSVEDAVIKYAKNNKFTNDETMFGLDIITDILG